MAQLTRLTEKSILKKYNKIGRKDKIQYVVDVTEATLQTKKIPIFIPIQSSNFLGSQLQSNVSIFASKQQKYSHNTLNTLLKVNFNWLQQLSLELIDMTMMHSVNSALQSKNAVSTSIKYNQQISRQSTSILKGCMYIMFYKVDTPFSYGRGLIVCYTSGIF